MQDENLSENWGSLKEQKQKIKTWMGNLTGKVDKKATKTGKNDKTNEKLWNMLGQKGKSNTRKNTIQLEKVLAKEGSLKSYQQKVKQYRQNRTFPKQRKKILPTSSER